MKMRRTSGSMRKRPCRRPFWWTAAASMLGIALLAAPAAAQEEEEALDSMMEEEEAAEPMEQEEAAPEPMPMDQGVAPFSGEQVEYIKKEMSANNRFEYHGYLRSGFGTNSKGTDQVAFQAPGAYAKYRLGNETETYGEASLVANWTNPESDGAWFKTVTTLAYITGNTQQFDIVNPLAVQEAYGEAGRVIESMPEVTFWAGHRFYRRRDIHINDFFYFDMSGLGGGFQGMDMGVGKLSVAYLGATDETLTANGLFAKNGFDIRLSNIDVGTGELELWLNPVIGRGDGVVLNRHGVAGGVVHTLGGFMGGFNELSVQFGYGGAANLSTYIPGADNGWMLRVVDRATIQPSEKMSLMWGGVLQLDNTDGVGGANMWISLGARPVFHMGKYTAVAVEGGIDAVQPDGGEMGLLTKLTVAPQIRAGANFWGRPVLRAFATAAFWNDPIQGAVGADAFGADSFGMTFGMQMESWW